MVKRDDGMTVNARLGRGLVGRIDRLAQMADLTRSKLASNMVEAELADLRIMDALGLITLAAGLQNIKDRIIRKKAKPTGEKEYLGVWLKPETVEHIDRIAEKAHLSRSKLTANMIDASMPDIEFLESMGMVDVLLFLDKLKTRITQ